MDSPAFPRRPNGYPRQAPWRPLLSRVCQSTRRMSFPSRLAVMAPPFHHDNSPECALSNDALLDGNGSAAWLGLPHSATCAVCQRSPSRTDARAVLCRRRALHAPSARSLKHARPTTTAPLRARLNVAAASAARSHRLLHRHDKRARVILTLLVAAFPRFLMPHPAGAAYRCRLVATRDHLECAWPSSPGGVQLRRRVRATSPRREFRLGPTSARVS